MSKVLFGNAKDIQKELGSQSQETVTRALTNLRNQFSLKHDEVNISPNDKRLVLVLEWLDQSPGAQQIFDLWSSAPSGQTLLISLLVAVLSTVLNLLSTHYTFHALGYPIIKTLLTPQWSRKLNAYLAGSSNDLIISTLKLLNSISTFAHGRERKRLLESFSWEAKSLPKLFKMRRKGKAGEQVDPLYKPDIRTLFILFLLSFVGTDTVPQVKAEFLEQQKMKFLGIFKGLADDPLPVVRRVLEVCWAGIWSDVKLRRTIKLGLFNEHTIEQISKLYNRTQPEDEEIPADIAHHFLLAICTHPGSGICFKDQGWYTRDSDDGLAENEEVDANKSRRGNLYNKLLANVLRSLKANEDLRQQELTIKILAACPELVAGYWQGAALTLEPRLSSKWLVNIALFGSIISLPVPTSSFILADSQSDLHNPTPPPLSTMVENILPSVSFRNLAKGLSTNASGLVQHCTAIALAKCLIKYQQVLDQLRQISAKLEENEEDGQWYQRRKELEREMRKRAPAFEVIISFAQHREGLDSTKAALISESASRLLWLYHECLPDLVVQATLDIGKLVVKSFEATKEDNGQLIGPAAQLHKVEELHVYRLLRSSEQFVWSNKPASSQNTYIALLLKAYARSKTSTRTTLGSLLEHLLASSILFEEVPDEALLWMRSLPTTRRLPGTESPDGASLTDEIDGVVNFLDECIQRCLKTTHRYIDEMYSLLHAGSDNHDEAALPIMSPLLMTIFEQFAIILNKKLLSPSDSLAVATFLRTLVINLSVAVSDLRLLVTLSHRLGNTIKNDKLFDEYPLIAAAIRLQVKTLDVIDAPRLSEQVDMIDLDSSREVKGFIKDIEKLALTSSSISAAYELVDWVRLINQPIGLAEIRRVTNLILQLHAAAVGEFFLALPSNPSTIWNGLNIVQQNGDVLSHLNVPWLLINTTDDQLGDDTFRSLIVDCILYNHSTVVGLKQMLQPISRRLSRTTGSCLQSILQLLTAVLTKATTVLNAKDMASLKEHVFTQCLPFRDLCMSNTLDSRTEEVLVSLIETVLDVGEAGDRIIVQELTDYWTHQLMSPQPSFSNVEALPKCWIGHMGRDHLLQLLEYFDSDISKGSNDLLSFVEPVALSLNRMAAVMESQLREHIPQLLRLQGYLPKCEVLQDVLASALQSCVPTGLLAQCQCDGPLLRILEQADARWHKRLDPSHSHVELNQFMEQEIWFESTIRIICLLLASRPISGAKFTSWLQSQHCTGRAIQLLIPIFHTYLGVLAAKRIVISPAEAAAWSQHISTILRVMGDNHHSDSLRTEAASCISLLFSSVPDKAEFSASFIRHIEKLPAATFNAHLLISCLQCRDLHPEHCHSFIDATAQYGLQWCVNNLDSKDCDSIVLLLTRIVQASTSLKPHTVETFASFAIQNWLSHAKVLDLLNQTLHKVALKPVFVNRCLQGIIQHPQFYKVSSGTRPETRHACIDTLSTIFHLHPVNTCQVTHVQPLLRLYGGTLSRSDRQLLSIFELFERQRKMSIGGLLGQWNATVGVVSNNSLDALQSLNATVVFRSTTRFPNWRSVKENDASPTTQQENYDPLFLMLLFAQTLEENPPQKPAEWVEVLRTNMLSLLVRALSARDWAIRELALGQISRLGGMLQTAELQEKAHVLHILSLLKDSISEPSGEKPVVRLPTYITLLLAHALRAIFCPSHFIYPVTARFLLQRPKLDLSDVPLLFNMLYSTSDDWKKERTWILRYLSDGLVSEADWRVLQRRHTWDLLASLFQSSTDKNLRKAIFEVLASITCIRNATMSLILKSGFLSWIQMQLQICAYSSEETISWLKILENVLVVVDHGKIDKATNGHWKAVLGRCLSLLFPNSCPVSAHCGTLLLASRVALRLSLLSSPSDSQVYMDSLVEHLRRSERQNEIRVPSNPVEDTPDILPLPPHTGNNLHEITQTSDWLLEWGASVELLWQAVMHSKDKSASWDVLTSRLLVWRTMTRYPRSSITEWAARQALASRLDLDKSMDVD